jgi:hypothetical protein
VKDKLLKANESPNLDGGEIAEWDEEKYGKLPDGLIFAPDPNIKVTREMARDDAKYSDANKSTTSGETLNTEKGLRGDYAPTESGSIPYEINGNFSSYVYTEKYFIAEYSRFYISIKETLTSGTADFTIHLVQRDSTSSAGTIVASRYTTVPHGYESFYFSSLQPYKQYYFYFGLTNKTVATSVCGLEGELDLY